MNVKALETYLCKFENRERFGGLFLENTAENGINLCIKAGVAETEKK